MNKRIDRGRLSAVFAATALLLSLVMLVAHTNVPRAVADEIKDVRVINTESMPAKVRDVDNGRNPVHAEVNCVVDEGGGCLRLIYTVPADKRLVIEFASMRARVTDAQVSRMSMYTTVGGAEVLHYLTPTPSSTIDNGETSAGQQVRLYADAGTGVWVSGEPFDSDGTSNFHFTISGYLVDAS